MQSVVIVSTMLQRYALADVMRIYPNDTKETVIDKDSYVQLDNTIRVEYFETLSDYRRQPDTLSAGKLTSILQAYKTYHDNNQIDELKNVYMDEHEVTSLNP